MAHSAKRHSKQRGHTPWCRPIFIIARFVTNFESVRNRTGAVDWASYQTVGGTHVQISWTRLPFPARSREEFSQGLTHLERSERIGLDGGIHVQPMRGVTSPTESR